MDKNLDQKIIIESLAMDLKRFAVGLHRGSFGMADRFKEEAVKRVDELEICSNSEYLNRLTLRLKRVLLDKSDRTAEDALMFSTLFQNFALKNF